MHQHVNKCVAVLFNYLQLVVMLGQFGIRLAQHNMGAHAGQHFGAAKGSLGKYSGTDKNGRAYSGVAPWGNMPARPFFGVSEQDRSNILAMIGKAMSQAWGG